MSVRSREYLKNLKIPDPTTGVQSSLMQMPFEIFHEPKVSAIEFERENLDSLSIPLGELLIKEFLCLKT